MSQKHAGPPFTTVATSERKVDALGLAAGAPVFVDDLQIPGLLHAKFLWSPIAHARITRIDASRARALPGVVCVLTHEDVPRNLHTTAGQGFPEPSPYDTPMLDRKVRYVGDRVAAVAAETRAIAEQAVRLIKVEYEELPAVLDFERAMDPGAPVIHDEPDCRAIIPVPYDPARNLAGHVDMQIGDPEEGLEGAAVTVDVTTVTQYGQHTPIEPHVTICWLDERNRLVIRTSTQVPFHVRRIVAQSCGVPVRKIRVIKPRIGGGFGAKQEVLEDLVAMLCLRSGRPVKHEYTRDEEFVSARTRHPGRVRFRLGLAQDGTPTALDLDVLTNTGAYGSHALTVACNCGSKTLPLYPCPNVGFRADSVYTNLPVGGAYRGYGATQAAFAVEIAMDMAAEKLGLDPVELRRKIHVREGQGSAVFRALGEGTAGVEQKIGSCELDACLTAGAEAIGWTAKRGVGRKETGRYRRGVGMCALMQGSSIPQIDMGAASLKMNDDGSFNLLVGATDLGTGSDTVLAQIAAEALGVPLDHVITYSSDTDLTPFDVGAYASSTTYLSGEAVRKAAVLVREQILQVGAEVLGLPPGDAATLATVDRHVVAPDGRTVSFAQIGLRTLYETDQHQIASHASHITSASPPPFAAHFAEVEVDSETGLCRVVKYVAAVDCGTAINPRLAEGQTEGAVLNGLSYALTEEMIFDHHGRCRNPSFRHYKIWSTRDLPEMVTILVPSYEPTGPYGAKSVSEISINGPLPALSNAIYDAVGVRLLRSPFLPEKILAGLHERR
ncbi:MAG TPA: molybdopterin cofactor-binding domain-containing protein [Polyangia bacterium]|jgi:putative selenate reductase molybdopterin-binding subunit